MIDSKYCRLLYDAMYRERLSGGFDLTPTRGPKMKVIKVSIEMNGFLMWCRHFTNFPTCEELLLHIPMARRSSPDARAFVQEICQSQWCISYEPKRIIQYVSKFGVVIGRIVMEEVEIFDCVGFDPTKTVQPVAEAVV